MIAIFITALVCSVASLIALLGFSVMDVAPEAGNLYWRMLLATASFLIGWLGVAVWARRQLRLPAGAAPPPSWLRRTVVVAGVLYVLLVLLFSVG